MTAKERAASGAEGNMAASRETDAALILHADHGGGLEIARKLSQSSIPLVLHSSKPSALVADTMHELVSAGGQALALAGSPTDPAEPSAMIESAARFIGPISTLVLCTPWCSGLQPAVDSIAGRHRLPALAGELHAVQELLLWSRALIEHANDSSRCTIIGVLAAPSPDDPADAVARGAWQGTLSGLRTEIELVGARAFTVLSAAPGRPTRAGRDPRSTAQKVAELVLARSPQARLPDSSIASVESFAARTRPPSIDRGEASSPTGLAARSRPRDLTA